jgi:hypothetical protein
MNETTQFICTSHDTKLRPLSSLLDQLRGTVEELSLLKTDNGCLRLINHQAHYAETSPSI